MAYQDIGMLELANPQLASILRQRRFAEQLMQSGVDASPIQHPLQGLSRLAQALMGGYEARFADSKMDEIGKDQEKRRQEYMGGMSEPTQPPLSGMPAMVAGQPIAPPAPVANLRPFVAANLPNGIDPATDQIVRTVHGEAAGEPPEGQRAVASVIQNRMKQSGEDAASVIFKPNQFEPWNNPTTRAKLEKLDPNSPEYQRILANIAPVLGGVAPDPTNGATHFYSPTAHAALGRETPSWATGQAQDIGRHRFYNIGYQPGSRAPGAPPSATGPQTMIGATSTVTPGVDIEALQGRAAQMRARGNAGLGDPDSVIRSRAQGYLHEADRLDRLAEQERVRLENRKISEQNRADAQTERAQNRADNFANKVPSYVTVEDENGKPALFVLKPNGTLGNRIGSVPEKEGKLPTEDQSKAALYSHRMTEAEGIISKLEHVGTSSIEAARGKIPIIGNITSSAEYQSLEQAKRNFINATLRRESGANIQPSEFENADKQYFPKIGDSALVLAQKEQNRRTAVMEMRASSGPAQSRVPELGPARERGPAPNSTPASAPRVIQYDANGKRVAQ